jgi:hypothetical protein
MATRTAAILLLSTLLVAAPWPALAQVYKWVDENGVVNYGDKAPPGSKNARPFAEGSGSVSVVPGIPKEELERLRKQDEQRRVQQLEREVDELRARERARENAVPETVYTEVYVPAYGYPPRPPRPPGAGRPGYRPEQPIHRPKPPGRANQNANPPTVFTTK